MDCLSVCCRLNLTPTPPREKRPRTRFQPSVEKEPKRLRLDPDLTPVQQSNSTATGFIQICDVDPSGNYVQIKNMSEQIESLGGFKIQHQVEGGDEVVFRFHARSKLQGGASVTVSCPSSCDLLCLGLIHAGVEVHGMICR